MTRTPWNLIPRHLRIHWLRSSLTVGAVTVAMFLFCLLVSLVTTLEEAVKQSATNRVITQSAVSLFVQMDQSYQPKILSVPGVEFVTKFQWFGAFYQKPENRFAQFGIDHQVFFDQYDRDIEIVAGPPGAGSPRDRALDAFEGERRAAIIGEKLVEKYGWQIGDDVPLIPTIFTKSDGSAWTFRIVGIYRPKKSNVDNNTLWFRYDYLDETMKAQNRNPGVGCYAVNVADGYDTAAVMEDIDAIFSNGPQRTMTSSEAAFQASFVSMMGNLPMFVGSIGGAVVFAVFFSVVNTMLMAARQRIGEAGILKALGFGNGVLVQLMLVESLAISITGGLIGIGLALSSVAPMASAMSFMFPNFNVSMATIQWALVISVSIGLISGLAPAWTMARLNPTAALRNEG